MVRAQIANIAKSTPFAAAFIAAVLFSSSLACPAQPGSAQPRPAQPTANPARPALSPAQPTTASAATAPGSAPSAALSTGSYSVSAALRPSLDTVRQTLQSLRIDRWKKGTVRDEASTNIDSILRDLRVNLPPLLEVADAAPGTVSKLLPVTSHVDALYDVLLRVTEASRVAGPDDQAAQLQQALQGLSNARLALDERIQGSASSLEKQVVDLRATITRQAAERPVAPPPVAFPCVPPPTHKPAVKRKPAAKPSTATSAATKSSSGTAKGTQTPSH